MQAPPDVLPTASTPPAADNGTTQAAVLTDSSPIASEISSLERALSTLASALQQLQGGVTATTPLPDASQSAQSFQQQQLALISPPSININVANRADFLAGLPAIIATRETYLNRVQLAINNQTQATGTPNQEAVAMLAVRRSNLASFQRVQQYLAANAQYLDEPTVVQVANKLRTMFATGSPQDFSQIEAQVHARGGSAPTA